MSRLITLWTVIYFAIIGSSLAAEQEGYDKEFAAQFGRSPKYAVHIGFDKGLPIDGVMSLGHSNDAALYLSLNGAFPKTKLMPRLDSAPYVLVTPITEKFLSTVVSFHPTEILSIADLKIDKSCFVFAPFGQTIPSHYKTHSNVVRYKNRKCCGVDVDSRNEAVSHWISEQGGFSIDLGLDEKGNWDNETKAMVSYNGRDINVNFHQYFPEIFADSSPFGRIPFSCPACDTSGTIVCLSGIKVS